jgi:hypothetical protein
VLARRRRGLDEEGMDLSQLLAMPRPAYTGTIAEGVGVRKVLEQLEQAHGGAVELTTVQKQERTPTVVATEDAEEDEAK